MYRSDWELATHIRHHIAQLSAELRADSLSDQVDDGLASPLTQLRLRLGISLIQAGRALAGHELGRGLPTPSAQPAFGGTGQSH